jgi:hypothetical protein
VTKEGWVLSEDEAATQVSSGFCIAEKKLVGNYVGRLPLSYRWSE